MTAADADSRKTERSQLRWLKIMSVLEATTLLLLFFVAMPLKYLAAYPTFVQVMGPVHGVAFLAYVWVVVQTVSGGGWSAWETTRMIVAAFVPLGGFLNVSLLSRKAALLR